MLWGRKLVLHYGGTYTSCKNFLTTDIPIREETKWHVSLAASF